MTVLAVAHTAGHHLSMGQSTAVVAIGFAIVGAAVVAGIRRLLGFGDRKKRSTSRPY